jgi:hypothetical protein
LSAVPDPTLEALWKNVVDRWDDDMAHGAFLDHCQATDQLVEAAVRYRGMAGDRERSDSAKKRLEGVAILAMAKLEQARTPAGRERRSRFGSLLVIAFFIAATIILLRYLQSGP